MTHLTVDQIVSGLALAGESPSDSGTLELIVRRTAVGEREVVEAGELAPGLGLVGDNWSRRTGPGGAGPPAPDRELTLMNARVISVLAQDKSRWSLAGDQLFVDFDLSQANIPAGTRLTIGTAVVEVSAVPHTGCAKFVSRFGLDAMKFVNSPRGRELQLRGINARVVRAGAFRRGDSVAKETS